MNETGQHQVRSAQTPPRPSTPPAPPPPSGGRQAAPVTVKIDTPGATVEIEAEGELDTVAAKALELFHAAGGWPQPTPSAAGFTAERRGTWDAHSPINLGGAG